MAGLDQQGSLNVSAYPNPSNGQFNLSYPTQPEAGILEVLDMQGRVVYQSRLAAWSQVHAVELEGEAAGMYQCRLIWGTKRHYAHNTGAMSVRRTFVLLSMATTMQLAANTKAQAADNVKAVNATLGTSELIETNQKQVNEIYLATIGKDVKEFTTEQAADLLAIADQCPMVGGNAVYRARALYSLIDEEQVYDDESLCLAHGIIVKRLNEAMANAVSVIPNPASDEATLVLTNTLDEPGIFVLYDALGAEVMRHAVPKDMPRISFNIAPLAPALYHYQVRGPSGVIGNGKLTVVR